MSDEPDRKLEMIAKIAGTVVEAVSGMDMVGGTLGFLRDPKGRDVVVPPDLHLVKPAPVDADGNVRCIQCGVAVPFAQAVLVGSDGFSCGRHAVAGPELGDVRVRRRIWPWLAGGAAVIAIGVGAYLLYQRHEARLAFEARYPIEATTADELAIDGNLARWRDGETKLVAALGTFEPTLAKLHLGAACGLHLAARSQSEVDAANTDDDRTAHGFADLAAAYRDPDPDRAVTGRLSAAPQLAQRAQVAIDQVVEAGERGRFRTLDGRDAVTQMLHGPLVVVAIVEDHAPAMNAARDGFDPGRRAGTAFAFDPATGKLRCAGEFAAESSGTVQSLTGGAFDNADAALRRDLDAQTEHAIAAGLRDVE